LTKASLVKGGHEDSTADYVVNTLDRPTGGPDDNAAQAGHLVPTVAATVKAHRGKGGAEGFDASEDGTGNKMPVIAFATSALDHPRDDGLTPPLKKNSNGQGTGSGASVFASVGAGVRRLTPTECCRLQGFPDDWFGEPNERPDGPRYAALGDAVTVNVAEWLGQRIADAMRAELRDAA